MVAKGTGGNSVSIWYMVRYSGTRGMLLYWDQPDGSADNTNWCWIVCNLVWWKRHLSSTKLLIWSTVSVKLQSMPWLIIWVHSIQACMLIQRFSHKQPFSSLTAIKFPLQRFAVYHTCYQCEDLSLYWPVQSSLRSN